MALAAASAAGQTLTQLAPLPMQWNVKSSCFLDAQKGFVCGEMMSLYKTLDGGASWQKILLPGWFSDPLYDIEFLDANTGIVCGNSSGLGPDVYRTTDGGNTWNQVTTFPLGGSWTHQDYVSSTTGFIGSNGGLVRTTDAGASFQVRSGYGVCPYVTGLDFLDANVGFVTGALPTGVGGLFKTNDGGLTWQHKLNVAANGVIYVTASHLLAATSSGIVRSVDGGDTWTTIYSGFSAGLVDIELVSATSIAGVTGSGDIWLSTDLGFSWTQTWIGEGELPGTWSVDFTDATSGTVTGVRGLVYATHDGGLTWSRMNRGAAFEGNGLTVLGNDTAIAVGYHGFAERLKVGADWNLALVDPPTFGRNTAFKAVDSVGTDFVYAVGSWGGLGRSIDGGATWQNLVGAVSLVFTANDVEFTDASNGWMTGFDYSQAPAPLTYRTTDGGNSWFEVQSAHIPGVAIEVIGHEIWIQGESRAQWYSSNGGASFTPRELPYNSGSFPSVTDMSYADSLIGYVCGYDGYLVKTTDGGQTWTQIGSVQQNTHFRSVFAKGPEVFVCGSTLGAGFAFVRRSLDGGATWTTWTFGGKFTTPYKLARSQTRLFMSGYNGETWMLDGLADYTPSGSTFCAGDGSGAPCPCGNSGTSGNGCANSVFSSGTRLAGSGTPGVSPSSDTFALTASQITGPGLFFQATSALASGTGIAFGDGLLCSTGTITRLAVVFPTAGVASYPSAAAPTPIRISGAPLTPGDVRHYQCWYRDALAYCTAATFNLTPGISVTWAP